MRIYYDTEFLEDGRTIELISIGLVAEDGREYYAVASDGYADRPRIDRVLAHPWLREHVVPSLPLALDVNPWRWDVNHPDIDHVKSRREIAQAARDFILETPDVELWAWYGAYDHVALCQLWGRMVDLPDGVPMYTHDLKQECDRLGNPPMPQQAEGLHNALADARHVKVMAEFLSA
ncbi:3'-5' exoribonuclease [Actinomadura rudentiformis]|uniref:3'-5' exoribonuclease n=1 Tax=Actinomadura rudentiformis TaxID=359158 RepID=A0A6H9YK30_9ACTN|nr:3'-5' exoribonuclease [Actinomadura rudentiformis]KAB2347365.1 3'-5' exoribonuclease [Actinomadura rudentiformis]